MWIALGVLALIVFCARRWLVIVDIVGESMAPFLMDGDTVVASRVFRRRFDHGDVLVFWPAPFVPSKNFVFGVEQPPIKRVAALAGEPWPHPATGAPDSSRGQAAASPALVPDGHLFFLGDNLRRSIDSRHWGVVSVDQVLAKMVLKIRIAGRRVPEPGAGVQEHHGSDTSHAVASRLLDLIPGTPAWSHPDSAETPVFVFFHPSISESCVAVMQFLGWTRASLAVAPTLFSAGDVSATNRFCAAAGIDVRRVIIVDPALLGRYPSVTYPLFFYRDGHGMSVRVSSVGADIVDSLEQRKVQHGR